jgi:hypothetical protein
VKRYRVSTAIAAAAFAIMAGGMLSGCTTATPALSECAMVTNGGFGSNGQGITAIVHPGGKVSVGNGETPWYFPCDARNFVTAKSGGDRDNPLAVRTAPSGTGANVTPGVPVYVWSSVYFTLNQNESVMDKFLPFCLKYGCATNNPQTDASIASSAHSSSPGWENMLLENMGPAIDRASEQAVQNFGPTLWQDQSDWGKLGDEIAANLNAQLDVETGSNVSYFCGDASTESNCAQMTVVVSSVTPEDPAVITTYNQQVQAEQSGAANAARLRAAQELYGSDAQYFLGLQDTAADCPKCTFYIGAPSNLTPTSK